MVATEILGTFSVNVTIVNTFLLRVFENSSSGYTPNYVRFLTT